MQPLKYIHRRFEGPYWTTPIATTPAENTRMMLDKLDEIQAGVASLENKYQAIENIVEDVPKPCADIIKSASSQLPMLRQNPLQKCVVNVDSTAKLYVKNEQIMKWR